MPLLSAGTPLGRPVGLAGRPYRASQCHGEVTALRRQGGNSVTSFWGGLCEGMRDGALESGGDGGGCPDAGA
jgi:hypothetical protein